MLITFDLLREWIEERLPYHKAIGLQLVEMGDRAGKIRIPFHEYWLGQPRSKTPLWHSGSVSMAMDVVGGVAGMSIMQSQKDVLSTINMHVDYYKHIEGKTLIFSAEMKSFSDNRFFVTTHAYYEEGNGEILAEGKSIFHVKRHKAKN